jgi:hypothetical protein
MLGDLERDRVERGDGGAVASGHLAERNKRQREDGWRLM